jgi:hypothetical protein
MWPSRRRVNGPPAPRRATGQLAWSRRRSGRECQCPPPIRKDRSRPRLAPASPPHTGRTPARNVALTARRRRDGAVGTCPTGPVPRPHGDSLGRAPACRSVDRLPIWRVARSPLCPPRSRRARWRPTGCQSRPTSWSRGNTPWPRRSHPTSDRDLHRLSQAGRICRSPARVSRPADGWTPAGHCGRTFRGKSHSHRLGACRQGIDRRIVSGNAAPKRSTGPDVESALEYRMTIEYAMRQ